jgi:hypothetical protein
MQIEVGSKLPEQVLRNDIKSEFTGFIQSFRDTNGDHKYKNLARNVINNSKHTMIFSFRDLMYHNQELATLIFNEYYKYEPIINSALN